MRPTRCVGGLSLTVADSSVAKGKAGGGGQRGYSPPIGMSTKMQNKKNIMLLALLRLFYALE